MIYWWWDAAAVLLSFSDDGMITLRHKKQRRTGSGSAAAGRTSETAQHATGTIPTSRIYMCPGRVWHTCLFWSTDQWRSGLKLQLYFPQDVEIFMRENVSESFRFLCSYIRWSLQQHNFSLHLCFCVAWCCMRRVNKSLKPSSKSALTFTAMISSLCCSIFKKFMTYFILQAASNATIWSSQQPTANAAIML